jgi:DNA-binding PadR family transcriptional regulator
VTKHNTQYAPSMMPRRTSHGCPRLLGEDPTYGLHLRGEFEASAGEVWPLNVGQVYTTLQWLGRDGLVEPDGPVRRDCRRASG